jgi:hypothetical protein
MIEAEKIIEQIVGKVEALKAPFEFDEMDTYWNMTLEYCVNYLRGAYTE